MGVFSELFRGFLAFHIISVICWFAGLFYLPRLFVYHAMTEERAVFEQLKVMEYKLYYYIMHPALLMTLITGVLLVINYCSHHVLPGWGDWQFWLKNWLVWKIFLVLVLVIFHVFCGKYLRDFKTAKTVKGYKALRASKNHQFFRIFNEIPTVLLIIIIFLVVLKP
jgi:protoporphyrinogen IX oxidase